MKQIYKIFVIIWQYIRRTFAQQMKFKHYAFICRPFIWLLAVTGCTGSLSKRFNFFFFDVPACKLRSPLWLKIELKGEMQVVSIILENVIN